MKTIEPLDPQKVGEYVASPLTELEQKMRQDGLDADNWRAERLAKVLASGCPQCIEIETTYKGFGPSHNGSRGCESGSIASGGTHAHCTCDACF